MVKEQVFLKETSQGDLGVSDHQENLLNSQMLGLSGYFCEKTERAEFCAWVDVSYVQTQNLKYQQRDLGLQAGLCHGWVVRGLTQESEFLAKGRPPEAKGGEDQWA